MLEVELDIFSGMTNPSWRLTKQQEAALYEMLRAEPTQLSPAVTTEKRLCLGYRGVIVRRTKSDGGAWEKANAKSRSPFPEEFRVGLKPARKDSAADWLVKDANKQGAAIADPVLEVAARGVALAPRTRGPADPSASIDRKQIVQAEVPADAPYKPDAEEHNTWWACGSNYFSANIQFFNDPAHVTRNNCYCFASNHMPDIRYALPGRRAGHPAQSMTCASVVDGLRADGWKDGCEPNALTIVCVIWPGFDYHFY